MADTVAAASRLSGQRLVLLLSLALGHTLMHCFQQGWYILLPPVKQALGLNDVQYGAIESARALTGSMTNIPAGALSDLLRKQWVSILILGLIGAAVAYLTLSLAPSYPFVLAAAAMVGISISLWHPPALSTLSARLRDRLGFALSVHGMGGEIGNTVGPLVLGFLIGAVAWRMAAQIMTVPVVIFAVGLWLALRNFPGREGSKVSGRQYLAALNDLFRNRVILGILVSRGFMHMGTGSVFAFFSLYLQQDLGFSPSKAGMYYAVLMGSGIVSQPLMGYLSDRVGRKVVIVPSIFVLGLSTGALVWAGGETGLLLTAIAIGLFIYSVGAIVQAAAMDVTDERAGATTIGLLFASSSLFGIPSPVIAGAISTAFGTKSVFLYSGAMMVLAALIMAPLPMGRAPGRETGGGARSPH